MTVSYANSMYNINVMDDTARTIQFRNNMDQDKVGTYIRAGAAKSVICVIYLLLSLFHVMGTSVSS